MKNNTKKILRWIFLIVWVMFIFIMSQTPGNESSEQSKLVLIVFSYLGIDLNSIFGDLATFIIRKGAHFTEYFILYILVFRVLNMYYSKKKSLIMGVLCVFLYACSDEFHQYFIPGRVAAFKDVLIDTSGGIFASLITAIIGSKKNRGCKKRS